VPVVYHISTGRLHCHYCGETYAFPESCPSCGETRLISLGCGTQRAQEELEYILPAARILRMDADTTGKKHDFDTSLYRLVTGKLKKKEKYVIKHRNQPENVSSHV
jgi:primosomal protein N' (replication factor Y)